MKHLMFTVLVGLTVGLGLSKGAAADDRAWAWSPLGVGLAAPIQLPFMESDVYGLRFGGFFADNAEVRGLDFGLVELTTGSFGGIAAAGVNWTMGSAYGVQFGALANVVGVNAVALHVAPVNAIYGDAIGAQLGFINFDTGFRGARLGFINWSNTVSAGLEMGFLNVSREDYSGAELGLLNFASKSNGLQLGLFNISKGPSTGVQVGLVNAADYLSGVQIGLINMICKGPVPLMVLANASF